ncbi:MAG: MarR family winged helix-turn-helix transcriptional regulator [Actinocrinis sp.]
MDLRQIFDDLVRFETELWDGVDARLRRDADLPLGSLNVLLVVERTENCRVNEIAAALSITIGGASQAVDRLEKRGLCARRPNPQDRRSSIIRLTAAGQRLTAGAGPIFDEELAARLAAPLSPAQLDQLAAALGILRTAAPGSNAPADRR